MSRVIIQYWKNVIGIKFNYGVKHMNKVCFQLHVVLQDMYIAHNETEK